jgi:hypothetical protein
MSWGNKIAIAYSIFVVLMISLVTLCVQQKDIFLVSEDYYKDEIEYQSKISKKENLKLLSSPIEFKTIDNRIEVKFPVELYQAKGIITFYRPSNAKIDKTFPINIDENGVQIINTSVIEKGLWLLKLDIKNNNIEYYKEEKIQI